MLLDVIPHSVLEPTEPYEKSTGRLQFESAAKGTLFVDALFRHDGKWWMYYGAGASDEYVGLAQAPATAPRDN